MPCKQFMLDLSGNSAIPSHYMLGIKEVSKWVFIQTTGYDDIQVTRHFGQRGCYIVQTSKEGTADFLASFKLEIKVQGRTHSVPLRRRLNGTGTRVRFFKTCEEDFAYVPNSYFDDMLTAAGCEVVSPTIKCTHEKTNLFDGMRMATIDRGSRHLDRDHEYTDANGKTYKWRLEYAGQPYHCFRGCGIFHEDGKRLKKMK